MRSMTVAGGKWGFADPGAALGFAFFTNQFAVADARQHA